MWDCIVNFSTWVERNSGQIQIVIGLIALFFAVLGYRGLLKQLLYSNTQDSIANKQRFFELKLRVYSLLSESNILCKTTITEYKEIIHDYEQILNAFKKIPNKKESAERIERIITSLKNQQDKIKSSQERTKKLMQKTKGIEFLNAELSESYLIEVLSLNSQLNSIAQTPNRLRVYIRRHKKRLSID